MEIKNLTIRDIQTGLDNNDFTGGELAAEYFASIKKENQKLNVYLSVFDDKEMKFDKKGELWGSFCAVKDNILIEDTIATAGSKILENYKATYSATVIRKLIGAGVNFLGKTNLDEFAMGSSTENSAFGPAKNPHDLKRVPGGSSGGSGAAVAAGLATFALGSDTGGSIRTPASFCGVVGLKPTYGRVSRHGLIAMGSSLDQIGSITKNVYDSALVLKTIAGRDPLDSTTAEIEVPDYTKELKKDIKGLKIGVPKEYFAVPAEALGEGGGRGLDPDVEKKIREAISIFKNLGAEIIDVSLPHSKYALAVYYIIMPCEVSANLARFDGIKYGYSVTGDNKQATSLLEVYEKSRAKGFGNEPRRRIMLGTYALSAGYYDAYYLKAQKVRTLIKKDFDEAFKKVDVIIGPTSPAPAFKIGEKEDPLSMYLADIYTVSHNLAGIPAISIPCGFIEKEGSKLPVGLQIAGKHFNEGTILRAAHNFEQALKNG